MATKFNLPASPAIGATTVLLDGSIATWTGAFWSVPTVGGGSSNLTIDTNPPSGPEEGDRWLNPDTGVESIWVLTILGGGAWFSPLNGDSGAGLLKNTTDTFTGTLTISGTILATGTPTLNDHVTTKGYIDTRFSNVNNTADSTKPVSTAQAAAIKAAQQGPTIMLTNTPGATTGGTTIAAPFSTVQFDSSGAYNVGTRRFTPQVAGWYQVNAIIALVCGASATEAFIDIHKNTTEFARGARVTMGAGQIWNLAVSSLVSMNGTTDYITLNVYSGVSVNFEATSSTMSAFLAYRT